MYLSLDQILYIMSDPTPVGLRGFVECSGIYPNETHRGIAIVYCLKSFHYSTSISNKTNLFCFVRVGVLDYDKQVVLVYKAICSCDLCKTNIVCNMYV